MSWYPPVSTVAVLAIVSAAAIWDVTTRRLPNGLTIGAAIIAIAIHAVVGGWSGVLTSASGWCVGFALFFPLFVLGGMGAGDVKLLAAIGAWLGPSGALWTGFYGALAGGAAAVVISVIHGYSWTAFGNILRMLQAWSYGRIRAVEGVTLESNAGPRVPYAVPIAVGAVLTVWMP